MFAVSWLRLKVFDFLGAVAVLTQNWISRLSLVVRKKIMPEARNDLSQSVPTPLPTPATTESGDVPVLSKRSGLNDEFSRGPAGGSDVNTRSLADPVGTSYSGRQHDAPRGSSPFPSTMKRAADIKSPRADDTTSPSKRAKTTEHAPGLSALPEELLLHICKCLHPREVPAFFRTCKLLRLGEEVRAELFKFYGETFFPGNCKQSGSEGRNVVAETTTTSGPRRDAVAEFRTTLAALKQLIDSSRDAEYVWRKERAAEEGKTYEEVKAVDPTLGPHFRAPGRAVRALSRLSQALGERGRALLRIKAGHNSEVEREDLPDPSGILDILNGQAVDVEEGDSFFSGVLGGYSVYDHFVSMRFLPYATRHVVSSMLGQVYSDMAGKKILVASDVRPGPHGRSLFVDRATGMPQFQCGQFDAAPFFLDAAPEGCDLVDWLNEYARRVEVGVYIERPLNPTGGFTETRGICLFPDGLSPLCSRKITNWVEVTASAIPLLEATPGALARRGEFHFTYSIRLRLADRESDDHEPNPSARPFSSCQLTTRRWEIQNGGGRVDVVDGRGVVGFEPILMEGGWILNRESDPHRQYAAMNPADPELSDHKFLAEAVREGMLVGEEDAEELRDQKNRKAATFVSFLPHVKNLFSDRPEERKPQEVLQRWCNSVGGPGAGRVRFDGVYYVPGEFVYQSQTGAMARGSTFGGHLNFVPNSDDEPLMSRPEFRVEVPKFRLDMEDWVF